MDCPICKKENRKGKLLEQEDKYSCNYFKSVENKCDFTVYRTYFQHDLSDEETKSLIEKGKTDFIKFKNKNNKTFTARLIIDDSDNIIKPEFKQNYLEDCNCPICGDKIQITSKGYFCCKVFKNECDFSIAKKIAQTEINDNIVKELIKKGKTELLTFTKNDDSDFEAFLELDKEKKVMFTSQLCKCPICGNGDLIISEKSVWCSNFKNEEQKCNFSIWRNICYKEIPIKEILNICQKGKSKKLKGFKTKDKNFDAVLILNKETEKVEFENK